MISFSIQSFLLLVFYGTLYCQAQCPCTLMKCTSSGEPHFVQWYEDGTSPSRGVTCSGNNMFKLVHNRYVEFDIKIISGYGVDVTINFLNGQNIPICTARTSNFQIYYSPHCSLYDVHAVLQNTTNGQTLTVKHRAAGFLAIVTHIRTSPVQYTIQIFQPYALVPESKGQCSVDHCNPTRSILDAPLQPSPKQTISADMAKSICQLHLNNYQPQLRHSPDQRSLSFNTTIMRLFDDCVYDVQITGEAAAAAKSFEPVIIEDLIGDAADINTIESRFNGGSRQMVENFYTSSIDALVEVHNLFPRLQSNFYDDVKKIRTHGF